MREINIFMLPIWWMLGKQFVLLNLSFLLIFHHIVNLNHAISLFILDYQISTIASHDLHIFCLSGEEEANTSQTI